MNNMNNMSNNSTFSTSPQTALPPAKANQSEWKGLTMDELKMRRAKSLVLREVNRANMAYQLNNARDNVSQNGIRGLLFSNNTITGLKKADYLFIGAKAIGLVLKLYARRKR